MTTKSANAREENAVSIKPANSIMAAAGTAWDLDVAYKEAETARESRAAEEEPMEDEVRFVR